MKLSCVSLLSFSASKKLTFFCSQVKSKTEELEKKKKQWKWEEMCKMKELRLKYIALYCKKKRNNKNALSVNEQERLDSLEEELEYETILL